VFALLLVAVGLSGNAGTKSGIFKNLDNTFDFKSLAGMSNRDSFVKQQIPSIAKASKDFFHLSSDYFVEGASSHSFSSFLLRPVDLWMLLFSSVSFRKEPFHPRLSYEFSICLLSPTIATTLLCMPRTVTAKVTVCDGHDPPPLCSMICRNLLHKPLNII
jgi:hypothetical protein